MSAQIRKQSGEKDEIMVDLKVLKNEKCHHNSYSQSHEFQANASKDYNHRSTQQEINKKHKCPD